jgi:hypothetical protein
MAVFQTFVATGYHITSFYHKQWARRTWRYGHDTSTHLHSKMVIVKKLSSIFINELAACQHRNLLSTIELYKFEGELFVVTINYPQQTISLRDLFKVNEASETGMLTARQ